MVTLAPCKANFLAILNPIPRVPPDTIYVLFFNDSRRGVKERSFLTDFKTYAYLVLTMDCKEGFIKISIVQQREPFKWFFINKNKQETKLKAFFDQNKVSKRTKNYNKKETETNPKCQRHETSDAQGCFKPIFRACQWCKQNTCTYIRRRKRDGR